MAVRAGTVLASLAILSGLGAAAQRRGGEDTRTALREYARQASAFGVSGTFVIADSNGVLAHAAVGTQDPGGTPNDTSTLFYIASLSKQYIAVAILRLEDEGRLRLSDSIGRFLDDVPQDKRGITLLQLLSHRSGLALYGYDFARRDWAVEDRAMATRGILHSPLQSPPGTQFSYQNVNYILLTAIAERASQMPIESYLDGMFRRAGLRDTYVGDRMTDALRARVAWSLGDISETFTAMDWPSTYLRLGRGAFTTASDLYRWVHALARRDVLSDSAMHKLSSIHSTLSPGYGYGAGWFVRADSAGRPRVLFHGGDRGGYRSEARWYPPSGVIAVVLTNSAWQGRSITETVQNHLITVARGRTNPLPATFDAPDDAGLSGEFEYDKGEALIVTSHNDGVTVTPVGQRAADAIFAGDTSGWRVRERAGNAAMSLIDRLKNKRVLDTVAGERFSPAKRTDIQSEWDRLARRGGRLKSYQLLGARRSGDAASATVILRLMFERDSLLFGVGYSNDTLAFTQVAIANQVSPMKFARTAADRWQAYDWVRDSVHVVTLRASGRTLEAITVEMPGGSMVFRRTR